ncbi:hypothetical protein BJF78_28630 [Pseudonocardia sp. CNS-139]|nr:hypothetical protein BJF78_28630 [Pseudonocardia sp. CNS-139]
MPAFDVAPYVAAAVDCVLHQTFADLELVVVDDGSTDATPDVLAAVRDPRVRVVRRPNGGIVAALNTGLDHVRGELVARMDADDLMPPDRLARQVAFLAAHPRVVACGTDYRQFGTRSGVTRMPRSPAACRARLLFGTCIAHGTAMIRADVLRGTGLRYRPEYAYAEDYRFFSDLALSGDLANLPYVGLEYRMHPRQISTAKARAQRAVAVRVMRENLAAAGVTGLPDAALERMVFADGHGAGAALRHLLGVAPGILRVGARAAGAAGVLTAAQLVREQLNAALR